MTTDPQPAPGFDPVSGQPLAPGAQPALLEKKLLAPVWHTVAIVVLLLGNSFLSAWLASTAIPSSASVSEKMRLVQYAATIVLELLLLFLVWVGLRLGQTTIRELIGGRWETVEDFLLDVALGFGFFVVAYGVILGLSFAIGLAKPGQAESTKKLASMIAPHTLGGLLLFVALSTVAGFIEEIIFRGYLQRQIGVLTGNIYTGLVVSALVFGASHGYEGWRRMLLIFVLGLMFGFMALWRKSLRPGMIGHACFDSFQGIALFVATRMGLLQGH
jgi:membrane protease YdiL (CAAX protease family)